jgi:hypothetical protein
MLVILDCRLALPFDGAHLFRVVVVIRERSIDVSNVDLVTVGDRPRFEATVFDQRFDELDSDPSAFEMWLVV